MKRIILTVSNDLCFDQRMIRICTSLQLAGYDVTLVGRLRRDSPPLQGQPFRQFRLSAFFEEGFLFYAAFNLRLCCWLLFRRADILCAIDLDTILPVWCVSKCRGISRVFDAHEWFCDMKELQTRPRVRAVWKRIERLTVPDFPTGYTVSQGIVELFRLEYGHAYALIRNMPAFRENTLHSSDQRFILYQGAVNEGRCFEALIPAMKEVKLPLHIYGDGNFMMQVRMLIHAHGLVDKVLLKGRVYPTELAQLTPTATIGISLFDDSALHNRVSLANRFFDFIHAGIPQLCSDLPAYRSLNDSYGVAMLLAAPTSANIAEALNKLIDDEVMYKELSDRCRIAARALNWQQEEKRLIDFYRSSNL